MKKLKILAATILFLFYTTSAFALGNPENWTFYIDTDFAYYPESKEMVNKNKTHFSPLTGIYSGVEARVTGNAEYKIPTPLGDHWLLNGANVVLGSALEISPVSIKPEARIKFSPVPFLVFSAGAQAGTGWNLLGIQGMSVYKNSSPENYTDSTPFASWFLKWWAQGTFQFDTGAVIPGDWTHVVMLYSYQVYYEKITSAENQQTWNWQCTGDRVNGLKFYQNAIIAYEMPLVLHRAGLMAEADGYYKSSDYRNSKFKGDFITYSINPLFQFKLSEHTTLTTLLTFSTRRSYESLMDNDVPYAEYGNYTSREWYFKRIVLSWNYTF